MGRKVSEREPLGGGHQLHLELFHTAINGIITRTNDVDFSILDRLASNVLLSLPSSRTRQGRLLRTQRATEVSKALGSLYYTVQPEHRFSVLEATIWYRRLAGIPDADNIESIIQQP